MNVLAFETCWAKNKASDIKLVYLYSTYYVLEAPRCYNLFFRRNLIASYMHDLQYAVLFNADDEDTHISFPFLYGSQPSRGDDYQQSHTYSTEHNTSSFKIELRLYT